MNRSKKEEKKRGGKYPKGSLSERDYNEVINAFEEKREPKLKDAKVVYSGNRNVKTKIPK